MASPQHPDILLRCAHCGEAFVFSAGEQEVNRLRGTARVPRACPGCRKLLGR